ncbi:MULTISPECIES: hypothetical protein [Streptomyces]|uniref:Uncharacterized protein n=1 Tax=Streptomyces virens TaxID=285572 RepID=A0ABP6PBM9_9ACTN|nr:hypothetical protein [Streptomyces calvus]MBA8977608.1 hypothetical protein [Streptomyces calvus]MYS30517.1 hypothetical protein [Streptomyces sp. SID7804]
MDAELMALASTAGSAVVTALTTDLWQRAQASVGGLWRRAYPERADTVEAELTETRDLLLAAPEDDVAETSAEEWGLRFRRLLTTHPALAEELRRVLAEELAPAVPAHSQGNSTVFNATASGHGRVYQSAGNQTINER